MFWTWVQKSLSPAHGSCPEYNPIKHQKIEKKVTFALEVLENIDSECKAHNFIFLTIGGLLVEKCKESMLKNVTNSRLQ